MTLFVCHFVPAYEVGEGIMCLSAFASSIAHLSDFISLAFHLH